MTQPAPSYQPYRPLPPLMGVAAPPKPSRGGLTSLIAGTLALVTAGLAIGGSFAPITTFHDSFADGDFSGTEVNSDLSWWGVNGVARVAPFDEGGKLFGLSLVLVATLLVLGAAFAFVASRTRAPGPTTGGRSLITAGVGVLAGVVVLQSLLVLEEASAYNDRELEPGESLRFTPGLGLVLPLCALAIGVVAVVLAHVGQRPRESRLEPSTPRMGFPAPYGYQQVPGMPMTPAAPGAPGATPATGAAAAERPTDVDLGAQSSADEWAEAADDSSATTQRVSNATATGSDSGVAGSDSAVAGSDSAVAGSDSAVAADAADAAVAAPPDAPTPAVPAAPASASSPEAAPANASELPAAPAPEAAQAVPTTEPATATTEPATAETPADPTAEPATQVDTAPEPAASPATGEDSAEKPAKLADLPAAPPPPETKQD
ncbi:hypothetical protein [Actinophytocola sp.]|uniref:hypothetical protein n=1 Tax=Actinophytocola sp. TaxID=1872138 RepID=UPI00389B27E4